VKRLLAGTAFGALAHGTPFYASMGVLSLALILEWLPASPLPPVKPAAAPHVVTAASGEADARDTGDWAETILTRPLFTPGRKPPRNAPGQHIAAANGMPRLSGIMITAAGKRAIFAPEGGKPLVLAEGAALEDSTITAIRPDRVIVTGPKGELVLRLAYDHARAGGVPMPVFPQPGINPAFPNPGFNPGFNPGLNPGLAPGLPPLPQPPAGDQGDNDDNDAGQAANPTPPAQPFVPQPFPGPRGPNIPRERHE
jgi:hypothetical protein